MSGYKTSLELHRRWSCIWRARGLAFPRHLPTSCFFSCLLLPPDPECEPCCCGQVSELPGAQLGEEHVWGFAGSVPPPGCSGGKAAWSCPHQLCCDVHRHGCPLPPLAAEGELAWVSYFV